MKRIAFVFASAPHGSSAGREGLDALLATSALTDEIGVFFISDGVFQILPGQEPKDILARDYIATFKLFELYDIENCWVCSDSLRDRGLDPSVLTFVVEAGVVDSGTLRAKLDEYDVILRF